MAFLGRLSPTKLCVLVVSVDAILLTSGVNGYNLPRTFRHYVSCLNSPRTIRSPPLLINLQVENRSLLMEYVSGAAVSLILLQYFIKNFNLTFKPTSLLLQGVSGQIQTSGEVLVKVYCPDTNVTATLPLIVCESTHLKYPLLGRNWLDVLFPDWRGCPC